MNKKRKNIAQNTDDDETVLKLAAVLAANITRAIERYPKPKPYIKKLTKSIRSGTALAEMSLFQGMSDLEVGKPYDARELLQIIKRNVQSVNPLHFTKAMKLMQKEFGIKNVSGKKAIRKITGKRKKSEGRPSAYILPQRLEPMARVLGNKILVDRIIIALRDTGLLGKYLNLRILPILYVIRDDIKGEYQIVVSSLLPDLSVSSSAWDRFRATLAPLNDMQLKEEANRLVSVIENRLTELPDFRQSLLIWAFSIPESTRD